MKLLKVQQDQANKAIVKNRQCMKLRMKNQQKCRKVKNN